MKHIGFVVKKNELWYAVLDGTNKADSKIEHCGKHNFQATQDITDLMLCFYNLFVEIIIQYTPDTVAYKVHLDSKLDKISYMHCSLGVLAYVCKLHNVSATPRSGTWITAGKKKKLQQCIEKFPESDLKAEKLAATLIAWFQFEE